jgi:hypothetical protein
VKIQDGANVHYTDYRTVDIEKYWSSVTLLQTGFASYDEL